MTDQQNASPAAIGLRAQKGGAIVVAVAVESGEPRILLSTAMKTHMPDDRLSLEPYGVAAEMSRDAPAEAAAAVAEGRERQDRLAAENLRTVIRQVEPQAALAALLVNRAGWIADRLSYSLAWPEHVPVAELLAVRDALRFGVRECGIDLVELDEKSLFDVAAERLDLSPQEIEARLKALGTGVGKPWRKEQKLASLAAWIAIDQRIERDARPVPPVRSSASAPNSSA
jgi:hypothetical protein